MILYGLLLRETPELTPRRWRSGLNLGPISYEAATLHHFSICARHPAVLLIAAGRKWHECPYSWCTAIANFTSTALLVHSVNKTHVVNLSDRCKTMELYCLVGFTPLDPPQGCDRALVVKKTKQNKKRTKTMRFSVQRSIYSSRSWLNQLAGGNPSLATVSSIIPCYREAHRHYIAFSMFCVCFTDHLMNCTWYICSLYGGIKAYFWE